MSGPVSYSKKVVVVPILIAINVAVYLNWLWSWNEPQFLIEHFLVSWAHLEHGHYHVLLTSAFSHNLFFHLFINMFVLLSFGSLLERVMGKFRFLRFYLLAGIVGSLSHAVVSYTILESPDQPALGASGAIAGLVLLFSLLFPKEKILVLGLIPVPAIFGALAFIGIDIWGLMAQAGGGGLPIGHGAHLGGSFTGILYYLFIRRQRKKSRL